MGKLSGSVLILAGVSLAAYTLSSQYEGTANVTAVPSTETTASNAPAARVAGRVAEVAPQAGRPQPVAVPAPDTAAPAPQKIEAAAVLAASPAPLDAAASTARRPRPASVVQIGEAPPRMPVGESEAVAGPPLDRPALVRQIQRQLKRVGCYSGGVTGTWSPSVRQSMTVLMDRVNASLPLDQPDPVLLAMVESQAVGACSEACPAGQGKAANGRCLPNALVAGASGKQRRPPAAAGETDRKATDGNAADRKAWAAADRTALPPPVEGRMSLAGPDPVSPRQAARPAPRGRAMAYRPSQRSANARSRGRYRSAQRPSYGYSGWGLPFFLP